MSDFNDFEQLRDAVNTTPQGVSPIEHYKRYGSQTVPDGVLRIDELISAQLADAMRSTYDKTIFGDQSPHPRGFVKETTYGTALDPVKVSCYLPISNELLYGYESIPAPHIPWRRRVRYRIKARWHLARYNVAKRLAGNQWPDYDEW